MNFVKIMKKIFFLLSFLCLIFVNAQERNCGTMQYLEYLKSQDPQLEQRMIQNEISMQNWIQKSTRIIW